MVASRWSPRYAGPGRVLTVARRLGHPRAEVRRLAEQLARAQATDITARAAPTTSPRAAAWTSA
jgi:hypothetical protein